MKKVSVCFKRVCASVCAVALSFAGLGAASGSPLAGSAVTAVAQDTVEVNTLKGATLTLNGEIGINFYLDIQDKDSFDRIVLSGPDGEKEFDAAELAPESSGECEGLYKLTYLVTPMQTEQSVSIRLKNGDESAVLYGSDGKAFGDEGTSLSVKDYIDTVNNDDSAKSDLSVLVNALDVYGKYSSLYFGKCDDPQLDDVLTSMTAKDLEKYKFKRTGELPDDVNILGSTLLIDSRTSFRVYFSSDPGEVTIDGSVTQVSQNKSGYYIEVSDIAAADLDKTHTAAVGDCTMEFSALSYVYGALDSEDKCSENISKLAKALYAYNYAANMYFESSAGSDPTISESDFTLTESGSDYDAERYFFTYGDEKYNATYTPYSGGDWKVIDSYKITNRADIVMICEELSKLHRIEGRITQYRTAKDMADEWEIHNRGYAVAMNYGMDIAVARLKDVDMDKKDQGKSFDDFLAEFMGS